MKEPDRDRVVITRDDLMASAQLIEARFETAEAELQRLLCVRRLLTAAIELSRLVRAQTHWALVNHCGTAGTHSLREVTDSLADALVEYSARCRDVASELRRAQRNGTLQWQEADADAGAPEAEGDPPLAAVGGAGA